MKKLENLIPFITLLVFVVMLLMMSDHSFGAVQPICFFKMQTSKHGHLKRLIPPGHYRIIGSSAENQFAFQRLSVPSHGSSRSANHDKKHWLTLGETTGGPRMTVNIKKNSDSLLLYFKQAKPGTCVLDGSAHSWI